MKPKYWEKNLSSGTLSTLTPATLIAVFYRVVLSVLDPRKCEYPKDYSLDFEDAYMTTYLAS